MFMSIGAMASGNIKDFSFKVEDFNKLKVVDNVNVVYRCEPDSAGMIRYSGTSEFNNAFIFDCNNNTLKIQVYQEDLGKSDLPTVYVYSDFLTELESSSAFTVQVESIAPCAELTFSLIGNGKIIANGIKSTNVDAKLKTGNGAIILRGECKNAGYNMVGTGTIQADELSSEIVKCKIMGTGSIGCWATELLQLKGLGSTKVYYKGEPKQIKKSGTGKLIKLVEAASDEF
jgi:hypothetical protein